MKIAVIVTARASWAKLEPVCRALHAKPDVELQIIACASALLERYGKVVDVIKQDFSIAAECWTVHEGANRITGGKETGALLSGLTDALSGLRSDVVVVCADRHEVLGVAMAGKSLHLPILHLQGGERSGSIDDDVRDAVTQLADIHCVCTARAGMRVYGSTGSDQIILTGCPSIDLAKLSQADAPVTFDELGGVGEQSVRWSLGPDELPLLLVLFHPVTNEMDQAGAQMRTVLNACERTHTKRILFWPGEDAGQEAMAKQIRVWMQQFNHRNWHTVRSLPPRRFLRLMQQAACVVGNSSAGIREASYLGVPVVNIGTRQQGRERGPNVIDVDGRLMQPIIGAIQRQIAHGPYASSTLYGKGNAGEHIAEVLGEIAVSKRLQSA